MGATQQLGERPLAGLKRLTPQISAIDLKQIGALDRLGVWLDLLVPSLSLPRLITRRCGTGSTKRSRWCRDSSLTILCRRS
jgi:hypothetical protein